MKRDAWIALGVAVAVVLAVVLVVGYLRAPEATRIKVGMAAPDLELPSVGSDGVKTKLSNFRGRPVLLVMYMANCHACEEDAGALERLHREYLRKGLIVLGVAVDADPQTRRDFIRRHETTFIVMEDPGGRAVREAYGSWKMPEAYLIDATGVVRGVFLGRTEWRSRDMRERIDRLLPPPSGSAS
jgi:peroxiredoxin